MAITATTYQGQDSDLAERTSPRARTLRLAPARQRQVIVVGHQGATQHLADAATRRGHHVVLTLTSEELVDEAYEPLDIMLIDYDLVCDAGAFQALCVADPRLVDEARSVHLAGSFGYADTDIRVVIEDPFEPASARWQAFLKRAIDIVGAAAGLVAIAPVMALAMLAIRLETPGPIFFSQTRMGLHGRRFRIWKLRTMRHGNNDAIHRKYIADLIAGVATSTDGVFKLVDDPRITKVGRWLRRSSLDEVPQLWNVLKGDMSLVGPRPELPDTMLKCDPLVWLRQRVRPGLTGLWQVSGRCELKFDAMVELDNRYCQDLSLRGDLKILARTPAAVITARGAA